MAGVWGYTEKHGHKGTSWYWLTNKGKKAATQIKMALMNGLKEDDAEKSDTPDGS
jgi:hypothetical protein